MTCKLILKAVGTQVFLSFYRSIESHLDPFWRVLYETI